MARFKLRIVNQHLIPQKVQELRGKALEYVLHVIANPELMLLYRRAIENIMYAHPDPHYKRTGAMKHPQAFRMEKTDMGTIVYLDDEKVAEINMAVSGREDVKPYAWRWAEGTSKHPGYLDEAKKLILGFLLSNLHQNPLFKVRYGANYQMKHGPSRAPGTKGD